MDKFKNKVATCLITTLFISQSLTAYATTLLSTQEKILTPKPTEHTIIREYSSLQHAPEQIKLHPRSSDYPTQIVRTVSNITAQIDCDQAFQIVDEFFSNYITPDKFFYNTINFCSYDPETKLAKRIVLNSYFDPLNDDAISYLEKYIAEHNGRDLFGSPFYVESAKSLVVALDLDAGNEDAIDSDVMLRLANLHASHYFTSNYEMRTTLTQDIRSRFFSNQTERVLPFINKWFLTSIVYFENVLRRSDYVELRPQLIFLMDKNPKIFTPMLRLYYGHHCSKYENKHCLVD